MLHTLQQCCAIGVADAASDACADNCLLLAAYQWGGALVWRAQLRIPSHLSACAQKRSLIGHGPAVHLQSTVSLEFQLQCNSVRDAWLPMKHPPRHQAPLPVDSH